MADLNRGTFIGRLTRDPEVVNFADGGKVCNFDVAVTAERRFDNDTGQWTNVPAYIPCKAFNGKREGSRQLANTIMEHVHKGDQIYVEGKFVLEKWKNDNGENRQRLVLNVFDIQFLQPKQAGASDGENSYQQPARRAPQQAAQRQETSSLGGDDIPF